MTDRGALDAVSPLDGRYARYTAPLTEYVSEAALLRARVEVEVKYLFALADLDALPLDIPDEERTALRELYTDFDAEAAETIKQLETEGHGEYAATNHDVKAVEYYIRTHLPAPDTQESWVHFGLTSEDVNNLAYRLLVRDTITEVLLPAVRDLRETLMEDAQLYREVPMLARTHGQPATPTTYGKELAVYAHRLTRAIERVETATDGLSGKLAGASGTYAAHDAAYPDVNWPAFTESFVESLGLQHLAVVTQVNPCDDLAAVFDALRGVNNILRDLDVDAWLYISDAYLTQAAATSETGSSTMPHKVNPIDFENSEGNLTKANNDLTFLSETITTSRLQRDLSDSTLKRNIGVAFAHSLIGYSKTSVGLSKVTPAEAVMREDLEQHPEVIGEAVQTILRREGNPEAYERVKEFTRGEHASLADFREFFDELDVDEAVREELKALTPASYTGRASDLVEDR